MNKLECVRLNPILDYTGGVCDYVLLPLGRQKSSGSKRRGESTLWDRGMCADRYPPPRRRTRNSLCGSNLSLFPYP